MSQPQVSEPLWMELADALAIHEKMLALFGGLPGLRDEGLLQSALARPQHLFTYSQPTLPELAAYYAAGIVRNHPFLDGNKRTGFVLAAAFLEINHCRFDAPEVEVVERTLALAARAIEETDYASWLTAHTLTAHTQSS
jgi:death-on-curing protein